MGMQNVVLDTNCLIMSLSVRSPYYQVWKDFRQGKYEIALPIASHIYCLAYDEE